MTPIEQQEALFDIYRWQPGTPGTSVLVNTKECNRILYRIKIQDYYSYLETPSVWGISTNGNYWGLLGVFLSIKDAEAFVLIHLSEEKK